MRFIFLYLAEATDKDEFEDWIEVTVFLRNRDFDFSLCSDLLPGSLFFFVKNDIKVFLFSKFFGFLNFEGRVIEGLMDSLEPTPLRASREKFESVCT
jgi:hypothetical protein